jgi:hypothetical protein
MDAWRFCAFTTTGRVKDESPSSSGTARASPCPSNPAFERFDLEELRWYHENYRESSGATSEDVIARIRRTQRTIGEVLHGALFAGDAAAWAGEVRPAKVLGAQGFEVTEVHTVFAFAFRAGATALGKAGISHRCLATLSPEPAFQVPRELSQV